MGVRQIKEIFIVTDKGEFRTYGYLRRVSDVRIMKAYVPKSIEQYVRSDESQHKNYREWFETFFMPLVVGDVYFEGDYEKSGSIGLPSVHPVKPKAPSRKADKGNDTVGLSP